MAGTTPDVEALDSLDSLLSPLRWQLVDELGEEVDLDAEHVVDEEQRILRCMAMAKRTTQMQTRKPRAV